MTFKKVIPRSRSACGDVRVSFSGKKKIYANIYFYAEFLKEIEWEVDCRVFVYIDDANAKIWRVTKALEDEKYTFKLWPNKGAKSQLSRLQFKFSEYEILANDRKLKVVDYKIGEGEILIRL